MSNPRLTKFEDLELSVRAYAIVEKLGLVTVGDLLDLPRVVAPPLVAAELREALDALGLTYDNWAPLAAPNVIAAQGTIAERWAQIEAWLAANAPPALATFRPPATPADIAQAEATLGLALPAEYKALVSGHNGQTSLGPMVANCTLLALNQLATTRDRIAKLIADAPPDDDCDPRIERVAWHDRWVPIGNFQRDYLVLDLAPTDAGTHGQLFTCFVDDSARVVIADDCADLLAKLFHELQDGTIDVEEYR